MVKFLSVKRVIELLKTLDEDDLISPNKVGNLAIHDNDMEFVGYIAFLLDGEIEMHK